MTDRSAEKVPRDCDPCGRGERRADAQEGAAMGPGKKTPPPAPPKPPTGVSQPEFSESGRETPPRAARRLHDRNLSQPRFW